MAFWVSLQYSGNWDWSGVLVARDVLLRCLLELSPTFWPKLNDGPQGQRWVGGGQSRSRDN